MQRLVDRIASILELHVSKIKSEFKSPSKDYCSGEDKFNLSETCSTSNNPGNMNVQLKAVFDIDETLLFAREVPSSTGELVLRVDVSPFGQALYEAASKFEDLEIWYVTARPETQENIAETKRQLEHVGFRETHRLMLMPREYYAMYHHLSTDECVEKAVAHFKWDARKCLGGVVFNVGNLMRDVHYNYSCNLSCNYSCNYSCSFNCNFNSGDNPVSSVSSVSPVSSVSSNTTLKRPMHKQVRPSFDELFCANAHTNCRHKHRQISKHRDSIVVFKSMSIDEEHVLIVKVPNEGLR